VPRAMARRASHANSEMSAWVLLATATIRATKLNMVVGDKFFVDAEVGPGVGKVIRVWNVPFVRKKMPKPKQDHYQPRSHGRPDLGIASRFSIVKSDYVQ
jgi:hypothetical protein